MLFLSLSIQKGGSVLPECVYINFPRCHSSVAVMAAGVFVLFRIPLSLVAIFVDPLASSSCLQTHVCLALSLFVSEGHTFADPVLQGFVVVKNRYSITVVVDPLRQVTPTQPLPQEPDNQPLTDEVMCLYSFAIAGMPLCAHF